MKQVRYHVRKTLDYIRVIARPSDRTVEVFSSEEPIPGKLYDDTPQVWTSDSGETFSVVGGESDAVAEEILADADYIVIRHTIHHCYDIARLLGKVSQSANSGARLVVVYYSALWKPLLESVWETNERQLNWIAPEDLENFARLTDLEVVSGQRRILLPVPIPLVSDLVNRWLAPLFGLSWATMVHVDILRKKAVPARDSGQERPSVSVVVPARNESGNIEAAVLRLPEMGPDDELIFIEGNSTDDTWEKIQEIAEKYQDRMQIKVGRQDGVGKYDAVKKGFDMAEKDILMILDADLTVPPEELPVFYNAISTGMGEFINGSRLVYPMEDEAMRFFNILGNKAFALAFSNVLGQRFKDTLCGTKVMSRETYDRIKANREYFGDFDPFGDFDLIFGAARMGMKIVEVPVHYKERTYGDTNIQRWKHGCILLRMLMFASRRLRFI